VVQSLRIFFAGLKIAICQSFQLNFLARKFPFPPFSLFHLFPELRAETKIEERCKENGWTKNVRKGER